MARAHIPLSLPPKAHLALRRREAHLARRRRFPKKMRFKNSRKISWTFRRRRPGWQDGATRNKVTGAAAVEVHQAGRQLLGSGICWYLLVSVLTEPKISFCTVKAGWCNNFYLFLSVLSIFHLKLPETGAKLWKIASPQKQAHLAFS